MKQLMIVLSNGEVSHVYAQGNFEVKIFDLNGNVTYPEYRRCLLDISAYAWNNGLSSVYVSEEAASNIHGDYYLDVDKMLQDVESNARQEVYDDEDFDFDF